MSKRSLVFIMPANAAAGVEIEVSHVEARRLIRDYGLPNDREEDSANHDYGSWSRSSDGRYFVHFHT